ncbi:hypothetical protein KFK09_000989 [Dendrobium nobile]|uniref:Uncharacterized protein n=1 Tax=Dendrobium nobile TaxID=94219 RepID=A0A8T3CA09_DENNO|nr:hypothetical protein KFK09_000989 [Dendrobium nobile]
MTHYTFSDRRFLSFPAINPCSAVSSSALLADLSVIAADINFIRQTGNFGPHRRAAREAFRYSAIIVAFIDDFRQFSTSLTRSFVLGHYDLHVTLQKLRLLLADCGRGGARLWILLNANRIAGEFCVLLRSVSIALEFIPIVVANICRRVSSFFCPKAADRSGPQARGKGRRKQLRATEIFLPLFYHNVPNKDFITFYTVKQQCHRPKRALILLLISFCMILFSLVN